MATENNHSPETKLLILEDRTPQLAFEGVHLAHQYVNHLEKQKGPVTEDNIREVHRRCMGGIFDTSIAGNYRKLNVGIHKASITPPAWQKIPELMKQFVQETNLRIERCQQSVNNLDCYVRTIAFAHYAFARIHPFEDGNGRTIRVFCDLIAKKFKIRPVIIYPVQRQAYLDALEAVNKSGNLAHFEAFLIERLLEAYEGEEYGRQAQIKGTLERLKLVKKREVNNQQKEMDVFNIWSVLKDPGFE